MSVLPADEELVAELVRLTGRPMTITGRAAEGTSGGTIFVDLAGGERGVVTRFLGPFVRAEQTAKVLAVARRRAAASSTPSGRSVRPIRRR